MLSAAPPSAAQHGPASLPEVPEACKDFWKYACGQPASGRAPSSVYEVHASQVFNALYANEFRARGYAKIFESQLAAYASPLLKPTEREALKAIGSEFSASGASGLLPKVLALIDRKGFLDPPDAGIRWQYAQYRVKQEHFGSEDYRRELALEDRYGIGPNGVWRVKTEREASRNLLTDLAAKKPEAFLEACKDFITAEYTARTDKLLNAARLANSKKGVDRLGGFRQKLVDSILPASERERLKSIWTKVLDHAQAIAVREGLTEVEKEIHRIRKLPIRLPPNVPGLGLLEQLTATNADAVGKRSDRSANASKSELEESRADFMGTELWVDYMKEQAKDLGLQEKRKFAVESVAFCFATDDDKVSGDAHQSFQRRVDRVFFAHPDVRAIFGCPKAPDLDYCGPAKEAAR